MRFPFSWRKQRKLFDLYVKVQRTLGLRRKIHAGIVPHPQGACGPSCSDDEFLGQGIGAQGLVDRLPHDQQSAGRGRDEQQHAQAQAHPAVELEPQAPQTCRGHRSEREGGSHAQRARQPGRQVVAAGAHPVVAIGRVVQVGLQRDGVPARQEHGRFAVNCGAASRVWKQWVSKAA